MNRPENDSLGVQLLSRFSGLILLIGFSATLFLVYGAGLAVATNSNRLSDWLPANLPESVELKQFDAWFGDGHFVIVSWDGCKLDRDAEPWDSSSDDPRLERLAAWLIEQDAADDTHFIKKVVTSRTLLRTLTEAPMNLPPADAIGRLTGSVIGKEGLACVIVFLEDFPTEKLREAIGFWNPRWIDRFSSASEDSQGLLFRAVKSCQIPLASAHLGGRPIDNLAINEEGQRTFVRLAGYHADAIVLAMPSLIDVLTISGAIHLVNYYRVAVEASGMRTAVARALAMGMKPVTLCRMTTAFGLLSLFASDLTPIRRFGIFSALGMALMLVALFLVLPAALQFISRKDGFQRRSQRITPQWNNHKVRSRPVQPSMAPSTRQQRWKTAWVRRMIRHHRGIGIASLVGLTVLSFGLPKIRTSVDLLKLFDARTRILADYRWIEENLDNLVPLEVLVRFDSRSMRDESAGSDENLTILDRARIVAEVRNAIDTQFGEHGQQVMSTPMSAIAFIPDLPTTNRSASGVVNRQVLTRKLQNGRSALVESGYLRIDPESQDELWRIRLRVAAFKGVDFGALAAAVLEKVSPINADANVKLE